MWAHSSPISHVGRCRINISMRGVDPSNLHACKGKEVLMLGLTGASLTVHQDDVSGLKLNQ